MATGSQCGQARIQSVTSSRMPQRDRQPRRVRQAPRGTAMSGQALPLSPSATGHPGRGWERTYPGTENQLANVRAALRPLLRECPMADDVLLIMHELAANAVRHSKSREGGGTFTARLLDVPGDTCSARSRTAAATGTATCWARPGTPLACISCSTSPRPAACPARDGNAWCGSACTIPPVTGSRRALAPPSAPHLADHCSFEPFRDHQGPGMRKEGKQ